MRHDWRRVNGGGRVENWGGAVGAFVGIVGVGH